MSCSALQQDCRKGYVDPALIQYAVRLASATRQPERYGANGISRYIAFGASPRGSIHLIEGARALAFLRGRNYVLPEDVADLAPGRAAPSPRAHLRGARGRQDAR